MPVLSSTAATSPTFTATCRVKTEESPVSGALSYGAPPVVVSERQSDVLGNGSAMHYSDAPSTGHYSDAPSTGQGHYSDAPAMSNGAMYATDGSHYADAPTPRGNYDSLGASYGNAPSLDYAGMSAPHQDYMGSSWEGNQNQ
eukprot:TRINITY_DN2617_c0_g1_i1.p3 TRINITY_DN2617_c0_g1~~TRINITY_DN2617_c0_g1_i1.p3  ORF type:complete len:142 (-),score=44.40 TRINITY_DN2617_c0_g1_i1:78-503(-)